MLLAVAGGLFAKRAGEGLLSDEGSVGIVLGVGVRLLVLPLLAALAAVWTGRLVERLRGTHGT